MPSPTAAGKVRLLAMNYLLKVQTWQPASVRYAASLATKSNKEQRQHRLSIFLEEQQKWQESLKASNADAVKPIEIATVDKASKQVMLKLNPGSTPMDVAKQLDQADSSSGSLARDSALALVDDLHYWSMHRPLEKSCVLRFVRLTKSNPTNRQEAQDRKACYSALWRSGAMLLGAVFETAFKDDYRVHLVSSPSPYFPSGSFVYDCQVTRSRAQLHSIIKLSSDHCLSAWAPSRAELRLLNRAALPLLNADAPFECLQLPVHAARAMFQHNKFKLAAAERLASAFMAAQQAGSGVLRQQQPAAASVAVYRVNDFVDLLGPGPLLSRTGQISGLLFAAVHRIESPDYGPMSRVQGIAAADMSAAEVADWADAALEKAAELNSTYPPTKQPPIAGLAESAAASAAAQARAAAAAAPPGQRSSATVAAAAAASGR